MSQSARYTYVSSDRGMSHLLDQVNAFAGKYPEYRLFQVLYGPDGTVYAVLTTDPS